MVGAHEGDHLAIENILHGGAESCATPLTFPGDMAADAREPVTIGADDPVDEALRTMKDEKVRRLPVIDGQKLVGVVSIADLANNIEDEQVGDLVEAISAAP